MGAYSSVFVPSHRHESVFCGDRGWLSPFVGVDSFDQVKVYIQTYLKNLQENLLSPEDRTQLYLLFVSCFQVKNVSSGYWNLF